MPSLQFPQTRSRSSLPAAPAFLPVTSFHLRDRHSIHLHFRPKNITETHLYRGRYCAGGHLAVSILQSLLIGVQLNMSKSFESSFCFCCQRVSSAFLILRLNAGSRRYAGTNVIKSMEKIKTCNCILWVYLCDTYKAISSNAHACHVTSNS